MAESYDERIERLTVLAKRAYAGTSHVGTSDWRVESALAADGAPFYATVVQFDRAKDSRYRELLHFVGPRSFDALEAALCVLAGEPVDQRREAYELVERELRDMRVGEVDLQYLENGASAGLRLYTSEGRSVGPSTLLAAVNQLQGRCDECGATLAHYTGAGASGVLCPECDRDHADELDPGERT